ncbi:MAG: hypothetical protein C0624_13140 [Desulfuromonas sp.]|nr:MAG: hypothetical protein C0624_13140 [Desulfuromonas sp.]
MQLLLESIRETVNPASQIVGVNLVEDASTITDCKVRVRGKRLAVCQQIAYSRFYGWSTWCDAQTSHCVLGASNCGLIAVPQRVASGAVNQGVYQADQSAAVAMQEKMPRVPQRFQGVLTYPLSRTPAGVSPDLAVVYVNTAQAMRFVQAFLYHQGGEFVMRSSGDAGVCARGVAQVYLEGQPTIEIPCLGDRRFALAQDHELIVGIPRTWFDRVAEGLRKTHKAGIRYPVPYQIPESCELPETFTTAPDDCC